MRLSQVHGAAPFAGDHFRQIFFLLLLTTLGEDRRHRALRQSIIHGEGHVRTDQIFAKSARNNVWQALPAKFRWHGKRCPSRLDELLICLLEPGRRGDAAIGMMGATRSEEHTSEHQSLMSI